MRVLVFHPPTRDHRTAFGKRCDDTVVGVALLAGIIDDARAIKARGFGGVKASVVDDKRNSGIDAAGSKAARGIHPHLEVVPR